MRKKKNSVIFILILIITGCMLISYKINAAQLLNNIGILGSSQDKKTNEYKTFYNTVKEAMLRYDSMVEINVPVYDKSIYNLEVVKKILQDNPELQGNFSKYDLRIAKTLFKAKLTFSFKYYESKADIEKRELAVKNKVNEIISKVIRKDMKDYEKEAALHDYIINNTKYDSRYDKGNMPKESYTAYGVLLKGTGVCQGYAQAMDRLLTTCGIENMMVTGEGNNGSGWIKHAWNIVKIGGQYYQVDTTWDDPVTTDGTNRLRYSYFNLTDEQMARNHKWDKNNYPVCNNDDYSFDKLNLPEKDSNGKNIVKVKNYKEFYAAVKNSLTAGESSVTYKIVEYDDHPNNIKYWIESAYKDLNKSGSYKADYYKEDVSGSAYTIVDFKYY